MNTPTQLKSDSRNYILFFLLALIWSGSYINIKVTVDALPPLFAALVRVTVSMACLGVFFLASGNNLLIRPALGWRLWLAGLFTQALPFALLFYGEKFIAPALVGILNSTVSLWALLLGAIFFRDTTQWTPIKLLGLCLGFAGIVFIFAPSVQSGENNLIGIASVIGMAISYAAGGLVNQHVIFSKLKVSFQTNLFQQHLASVLTLGLLSAYIEPWPAFHQLLDVKVMMSFFYLGVIATALAWIMYFHLIREWGAVRTSSVMYIVPVLAIAWDLIFLHLIPTSAELIGAATILSGVVMIQWTKKKMPA